MTEIDEKKGEKEWLDEKENSERRKRGQKSMPRKCPVIRNEGEQGVTKGCKGVLSLEVLDAKSDWSDQVADHLVTQPGHDKIH